MNFMKATVLIAAAAAVAVAGDHAFGASPFYAPSSPSSSYAPATTAAPAPYGYTTYCTPNGCYKVPITKPGTSYVTPTSGSSANGYPAGSPCANGACTIAPNYATPRSAPISQPNPPYRTTPAPAPRPFNAGPTGYNSTPNAAPKYLAPHSSPFYSSPGSAAQTYGPSGNNFAAPAVSMKKPSQTLAAGKLPSPFYP